MYRIFIVEDNELIRDGVKEYFLINDYEVVTFESGQGVLEALDVSRPDAIILDIMLPDTNGYILAKKIRQRSDVPIIFLTAKESESDRVTGFEVGGDDYVVKPFSTKELFLRTEAILKRSGSENGVVRERGSWQREEDTLEIDLSTRKATLNGRELQLTNAEFEILSFLAFREERAVSREQVLGDCLGYHFGGSERTIDTHIANIRAALGNSGWIETVRGFGYRFSPE
ncbi:MAG: response regulator transcription factor [Spirochaetaceae bacterium]